MKSVGRILLLLIVIAFVTCSKENKEETCNCPPYSLIPSSPYDHPIWHPSGKIIGFNHRPIVEIDYYNGFDCPLQAGYIYDEDATGFWLINTDGTNSHKILPYELQTPTWSYDGKWIAFVKNAQIFKMPFDGDKFDTTQIVQLTFEGRNFFPTWSPDGKWIAYDSDVESDAGLKFIWKMKSDGSRKKRIAYTPTLGETRAPFWGVNNLIIHYRYIAIGSPEIFTMDTSGRNINRVTENDNREQYPAFSKLKEKIAYISQSKSTGKVGLWMIGNGDEQLLTPEATKFSWSPDEKHIVYLYYDYYRIDETKGSLWILNTESLNKNQLTFNDFNVKF